MGLRHGSLSHFPLQIHSTPGDRHPCVLQRSHNRGEDGRSEPAPGPPCIQNSIVCFQPATNAACPAMPTATCVCNSQATPASPVLPRNHVPLPSAQKGHWMQCQARLQLHHAAPKPSVTADGKPFLSPSHCRWRRQ